MTDIAAHISGLLLHPQLIQCKLHDIYKMPCILYLPMHCRQYLPDSAQTVSIHVDVSWEDRKQGGMGRQQQQMRMGLFQSLIKSSL